MSPAVRSGRVRKAPLLGFFAAVAGIALAVALLPREGATVSEEGDDAFGLLAVSPSGAPVWEPGDAWRIQFDEGEPVCWAVVVAADESGYRQGFWCSTDEAEYIAANVATIGARYVGRFDRSLGGVAEEETTAFFDWPLADGKSWGTTWYGRDVTIEAELGARSGRYQLVMSDEDGDKILEYDYDPELQWWSVVRFESGYTFRVLERATDWQEGAVAADAETRYEQFAQSAILGMPAGSMVVEDSDEALGLLLTYTGAPAGRFELRDPSGNAMYQKSVAGPFSGFATVASVPGTWSVIDAVTGLGDHSIVVRGISFERFGP